MAVCALRWRSSALDKTTAATLIVPDTTCGPFPVFYLLHGLADDHSAWTRQTSIERYAEGYPFIIVMPEGGRSYYTDAPEGEAYETALVRDLIPYVDRTFQTDPRREARVVGGLSMGGYGALKLALGHPDLFCSAVSHSCSRALTWAHEPFPPEPKFTRVFGPDPSGGPNDLFALAERIDRRQLPALRIDCGTEDALLTGNRQFHRHLETLGIPHEYAEFSGGHAWDYWDQRIQESLRFQARTVGRASGGPSAIVLQ